MHGRFGGPDAWLKALPDHQLGLLKCVEVVAVEMTVALDDASTTSGVLEVCGPSECGGCGMQAGQDHVPAGAQHPAQLGDGPAEVGDVLKRQRTDHQIDAGWLQRERAEVPVTEGGLGQRRPGLLQHRRRRVYPDDVMTEFGQAAGVTAGAARRVQGCARRQGVEDGPHDGLLELDERVAGVVVGLRPAGVAAGNVHDRYISTQLVDGLAAAGDTPDLGQPCRRLLIVVEQMTHERDPLDSEQELVKTQMPGHPLRMPDPHRARTLTLPPLLQEVTWRIDLAALPRRGG